MYSDYIIKWQINDNRDNFIYIPIIIYGQKLKKNINLGVLDTFSDIGQTIAEVFRSKELPIGKSFLGRIKDGD